MSSAMSQPDVGASGHGAVRWCAVICLAAVAAALMALAARPISTASAQSTQAGGQPAGLFAVAGRITSDTYGLYLVDAQRGSVVVYEYLPARQPAQSRLVLRAARTVVYDLQLESYNTEPSPMEIAELVRQARSISDKAGPPK